MNKTELVSAMSEKSLMTKTDCEKALNAFIASVSEALEKGDKVQLVGFGTFETRERKARIGRNPKNPSEEIQIPASNTAAFKAGKVLKESLNK